VKLGTQTSCLHRYPLSAESGTDLIAIPKSNLHQGQNSIIALLAAFELQQVIVRTAFARGKLPARERSRVVDRALTFDWIEKFAGLAEYRIFFAPEYSLALPCSGESLFRRRKVDGKMSRQPLHVTRSNLHAVVDRTAIRRTLTTVVITSMSVLL
jgi:hypothetical protein